MATLIKQYFPQPLLDDIVRGNCLPVIGSGFSMNANVPKGKQMLMWDALGKKMGESLPDYNYSNALDAISAYGHEFSRNKLIEKLTELLLVDQIKPGEAHMAFAKVKFKLICTTNFDFLLEQSYTYCRPILDESQLSISANDNSVSILKLHGDLHHPSKLVSTEEDYDMYIERNPIFATFLANQLITKTPLFIGYSIDDPDLRQIFKVVNERLGNTKRPAYTIKLNASHHEMAKFERRGIKVINIIDKKLTHAKMFQQIFNEIESYWNEEILKIGTFTQEESQSEVLIRDNSKNRLCFFSIPFHLLSFYKQNIFPIAESYGFVPITADEVLTYGDTMLAKISALIDKSEILVMDLSGGNRNVGLELGMAMSKQTNKSNLLLIKDRDDAFLFDIPESRYIIKPKNLFKDNDDFFMHIEGWFKSIAHEYTEYFEKEPFRLIEKNEFRASIISSISLLERNLRNRIDVNQTQYKSRIVPLYQIFKLAVEQQLINKKDYESIRHGLEIRNTIVHSLKNVNVTQDTAQNLAEIIDKIIKRLNEDASS
jgi:hypothetical protein